MANESDSNSLVDAVRQAIPTIRDCARIHQNKAAAAKLRILAKTLEEYLPETLAEEMKNEVEEEVHCTTNP